MSVQRIERGRSTDLTVGQLTVSELKAELQRRVNSLQKQRDELRAKLEKVERELAAVGALSEAGEIAAPNGSMRRMKSEQYASAIQEVLEPGEIYTISDIHDRLVRVGYNAKKNTLSQGMADWLVEEGILQEQDRKGRARQFGLA